VLKSVGRVRGIGGAHGRNMGGLSGKGVGNLLIMSSLFSSRRTLDAAARQETQSRRNGACMRSGV